MVKDPKFVILSIDRKVITDGLKTNAIWKQNEIYSEVSRRWAESIGRFAVLDETFHMMRGGRGLRDFLLERITGEELMESAGVVKPNTGTMQDVKRCI